MNFSIRSLCLFVWGGLQALCAGAQDRPPPALALDYTAPSQIEQLVVSPDNKHAAILARTDKGRAALFVISLLDPSKRQLLAAYDDVDVQYAHWVNPRRLLFYVQAPGWRVGYDKWGSFAVDLDGTEIVGLTSSRSDNLITGTQVRTRTLPREWQFYRVVGDGSDDVILSQQRQTLSRGYAPAAVARVNTRTLAMTSLTEGQPVGAYQWMFDAKGQLRVLASMEGGRHKLWWRPKEQPAWALLEDRATFGDQGLNPVALEGDDTLVVLAREGRDALALHTYDMASKRLDPEPLLAVRGFDVGSSIIFDHREQRVVGAGYQAQHRAVLWFDERLQAAQAAVDKALPAGRMNHLLCGNCVDAQRLVVHSYSDRHPGEYYLFDTATRRLSFLASVRPRVAEQTQGRRSFHRVTARDGLMLPVVVTHPAGAEGPGPQARDLPTVLLVHGGPWLRGTTRAWQAEPQFFAARGYRVLEVDFRGSAGLGWKHYQAGWGTWGLSMQDDLEDALLWAVREKLTDPRRVCIYGGSYGGYAALMGPVRHPGRFKCAVSHVGVTDLSLLYSNNWTDMSPVYRHHGIGMMMGDPDKDAERLKQTSPLHRVAEMKAPILLVQGLLDTRVSPEHADRFVSAARAQGVDIERLNYDEGHGWSSAEVHADFLDKVEAFIARHLKAGR